MSPLGQPLLEGEMIDKHTPVSEAEVQFLSNEGWNSGFGWKDQLDWWWEPSFGEPIWIEDDAEKMALWLSDREAFAHKCLKERAVENALDLLTALEECEDYLDQRADAEYLPDQPAPVGNEEMTLLTSIRWVIIKVRNTTTTTKP